MLKHIPTHLITGPLGAGKTSLIRHILEQRPADERWAVLVNEFGQIGLDAALLHTADPEVMLTELAGGCLCCVNGAPLQVALVKLLRQARPQRLFIEPSGLGHPAILLKQLAKAPWQDILAVQPAVMVVDAQRLSYGESLPAAQHEALPDVGLLVLNKAESLEVTTRQRLMSSLPAVPMEWTEHGRLPFKCLPGSWVRAGEPLLTPLADTTRKPELPAVLTSERPIRQIHEAEDRFAIGWRFHRDRLFKREMLVEWIAELPALLRAKAVLHIADHEWQSYNFAMAAEGEWRNSEWRRDSRIELIFETPMDATVLEADLLKCTKH